MVKPFSLILLSLLAISSTHSQCLQVYESGVDVANQNIIVEKHNALRLSLAHGDDAVGQPRACNMLRMKYDEKLQIEAQKIANTCTFKHVTVKDSRWSWVGQNLYMQMSTGFSMGPNWNSAIQSWFNEIKDYHYPDNPSDKTGHYTQVVWATTQYIGCGYTSFLTNGTFKYRKIYVCNYGPGGNIVGVPPYKTVASNGQCGCETLC